MKTHKRGILWIATLAALVSACALSPLTFAVIDPAAVQEEARTQLAANALAICIRHVYDEGKNTDSNAIKDGHDIFSYTANTQVQTGYWLEKIVQGKTQDAHIYCSNKDSNILDVAAQRLGTNWQSLVCNGTKPGLMKLQYYDGLSWKDSTQDCAGHLENSSNDYRYVWNDKARALQHLQSIYDRDWSTIDGFSTTDYYYLYLDEFMTVCTNGESVPAGAEVNLAGYWGTPVTIFNGVNSSQVYYQKDTSMVGSFDTGITGTNNCDEMIGKINQKAVELGAVIDESVKEAEKEDCKDQKQEFLQTQLNAASAQYNNTSDSAARQKAKDYIDKYSSWQFWEEKDGEIVCREIEAFAGGSSSPETQPTLPAPDQDTSDSPSGSGTTDLDDCFGSAGSLGWILCPVLKAVSEGVDNIYEGYVQKQFLEVDATKIQANSGSAVYNGWKIIRDTANIAFVIMFLVVLISQFTGVGLTNYSIKKMLPKLIIVAVLVNISFLLCQFAVDISNVLGYSLNNLFNIMGGNVQGMTTTIDTNVSSGAGTVATWVEVLALAVGIGTIGSWLIPLLLTLLSCAISVFFGAIILGARQAGVFILIVLAPAAIVCYALPNSKSIFDKWIKIFVSLLMVFPICGALMGGGYFASDILLSSSNSFFLVLVAMLLRVVPFFLIPGLVRNSMVALGNVGAKIANAGNKIGRTATGAVAHSDFVKRRDADLARMQGNATAFRGRALSKITGKPMSDRRKAKIARQYAKYNKLKSEEAVANPYAMAPGTREYDAMKNAARQNRIDSLAKNIALENTDIATDEAALQAKHAEALAAYSTDQTDENLATLQAYQDMLVTSDGGRTKLFDNYAKATKLGNQDISIEKGAQHLLRNHIKDIKPNNRDFFSYLGEASRISNGGDVQRDSFNSYTDQKGNTHYFSNHFANQGITSYDASSLAKMDEGSLDRLIQQAKNGNMDATTKLHLESLTRGAMTNSNIHVQEKIADKFNTLRLKMGYQTIDMNAHNANSTDSGTIHVQDNTGGNGSDSTILRTGNDDRANRGTQWRGDSGQLPSPLHEGNNYRQNDSGIWLPPSSNT